jgi:hypothetical protein
VSVGFRGQRGSGGTGRARKRPGIDREGSRTRGSETETTSMNLYLCRWIYRTAGTRSLPARKERVKYVPHVQTQMCKACSIAAPRTREHATVLDGLPPAFRNTPSEA